MAPYRKYSAKWNNWTGIQDMLNAKNNSEMIKNGKQAQAKYDVSSWIYQHG